MNKIMQRVEADVAVSITDLKKNPSAVLAAADTGPVAVLNHNRVVGYFMAADVYEALMEELDDFRILEIVRERENDPVVEVDINDLLKE